MILSAMATRLVAAFDQRRTCLARKSAMHATASPSDRTTASAPCGTAPCDPPVDEHGCPQTHETRDDPREPAGESAQQAALLGLDPARMQSMNFSVDAFKASPGINGRICVLITVSAVSSDENAHRIALFARSRRGPVGV
jgi:hypothetical protein